MREKCQEKQDIVDQERGKYMEFKKTVALNAINSRSGKPIPPKVRANVFIIGHNTKDYLATRLQGLTRNASSVSFGHAEHCQAVFCFFHQKIAVMKADLDKHLPYSGTCFLNNTFTIPAVAMSFFLHSLLPSSSKPRPKCIPSLRVAIHSTLIIDWFQSIKGI